MEKTIGSVAPDAELGGTLVTSRNRVFSDVTSPDFIAANNAARRVATESHLLIFRNCVYILDGQDVVEARSRQALATRARPITMNCCAAPRDQTSVSHCLS